MTEDEITELSAKVLAEGGSLADWPRRPRHMPADEPKPEAAKPQEKPTDVLGEIDGKPFTRADAATAKDAKPEEPNELTDAEHHAALTKRHEVIVVIPARTVKGRHFPEQRTLPGEVQMVSLRCAVAHRVLHGMSPEQVKTLREAFDKASPVKDGEHPNDEKRATAFEHWALRHIDGKVVGVPEGELAKQEHLETHAHASKLAKHRAVVLEVFAAK